MALHRRVREPAVVGLLLVGIAGGAAAQVTRTDSAKAAACTEAITAKQLKGSGCFQLAAQVVESLTERFYAPAPRDMQSDGAGAATAGSLAQSEPVPGVQPLGIGGASIAAVGADSGAKAIVAMTVNPAIFFTALNKANDIARASRIADLTVLFPVDNLDRDKDGKVDYFGARLRLNFNGSKAGGAIVTAAGKALLELVQSETDLALGLEKLLASAPRVGDCYDALVAEAPDKAAVTQQCGGQFTMELDQKKYEELRGKLAEARAEADARYLGLDLRFDFGDPTLGAVDNARATAIDAGLAWGRQFLGADPTGPSLGLKARAGARYTHLSEIEETSYAFDGAFGLEGRRPLDQGQTITASAGFEFRYGGEDAVEDELQTNYTVFRAGLAVPLAGMTGLTLAVAAPIDGPISPALSVNFNWGLLLPKKSPLP
jgi:hypothetical protein